MKTRTVGLISANVLTLFVLIIVLLPFYWMIISSFKPTPDLFKLPPDWIPKTWVLDHYQAVLRGGIRERVGFLTYFKNSLIVCLAVVAVTLILATPAAYILSRVKFGGGRTIINLILVTQMVPIVMLLIPLYIMFMNMRLLNTYTSVVLTYLVFTLPFSMWMLKGYIDTIPKELEEAAMIDGCSELAALWRVVLPSIRPGLIAVSIVSFLAGWDEFIIALTLLSRNSMRTLPPGIVLSFVGEFQIRWGDMMAASVIISMPVVFASALLYKYLVGGLTKGAVKG